MWREWQSTEFLTGVVNILCGQGIDTQQLAADVVVALISRRQRQQLLTEQFVIITARL